MWAGLLRMDLQLPMLQAGLALAHGPLMVSGFLGTLISLERAVALDRWWAYGAPVLTALGTLCVVTGTAGRAGPLLITLGSAALIGSFLTILRRQAALFTLTMALGAVAWFIGNLLWLSGAEIPSMVHWWAGFLVLTIVGERLELSRLASSGSRSGTGGAPGQVYFLPAAGIYIAGLILATLDGFRGLQVAGLGMLLMALWLARYDVARRTVRLPGLPRFIAVHLICGYFWLAASAFLWLRADRLWSDSQWQAFHYDAMLHTVFLGFVFSMIFAHAPIIFPAVTGRPLAYRPVLYVHGALLYLSLFLRVGSDLAGNFVFYRWSGVLNVLSMVVFLLNTAYGLRTGIQQETWSAA